MRWLTTAACVIRRCFKNCYCGIRKKLHDTTSPGKKERKTFDQKVDIVFCVCHFGIIWSPSHAFCTYILCVIVYPEFFTRWRVLPVGLVTKQVTRDTSGAGSWPKMVLDEEKALLSEEIVFEKVKFSLFYLLYYFRFRITSSCGILALYAPISPIDCADTIMQWNRRPL